MAFRGIDIRESGDRVILDAFLQDSYGAILASGTVTVAIYELQSDGSLKALDFNDNTFKTTALTTPTASLTHRTVNAAGTNTGIWTYVLTGSPLTALTVGNMYYAYVYCSTAFPTSRMVKFQYGSGVLSDVCLIAGNSTAATNLRQGTLGTATGTVASGSTTTSINTTGLAPAAVDPDQFKYKILTFASNTSTAALQGQSTDITASSNTGVLTVTALTTAPSAGDTFTIS